jgi:MoaA/NifB/PqqE/SkfB family radical SAM enzyme
MQSEQLELSATSSNYLVETIEIPELKSPLVTSTIEKLYVVLRFRILRFFLIWGYFGHPFKLVDAINRLAKLRKELLGAYKFSKLIKADGKYYYDINGPGIFSKGFSRNYLGELNRIYRKQAQSGLRLILFAITKKCIYKCAHCYEWDNLGKKESLSEESIFNIVERFQERGVGQIQLGGGEPLSRYNTILKVLKKHSGDSDFVIVTSGFQLTREKALRLKESGLTSVTISLDHVEPEKHDLFRGYPGAFNWVIMAAQHAKEAKLVVNFSLCATKEFVSEKNMMAYAELAKRLGIAFIWIIEPQSVGHYKGKAVSLSEKQRAMLLSFYERLNFDKNYQNYPSVAYPDYHQRRVGCQGSGNRFLYIDSVGNLKSCPMCGSSHGSAETANIDEAIKSMQLTGCGRLKDASV